MEEINEELNSGVEDGYDDNGIDNSKSKSGMGICTSVNTSNSGVGIVPIIDEEAEEDKVEVPRELDSNFGDAPCWSNGTIANDVESYMLSVIATFSNMDGLHSTPQYRFSRGISKFKQVSELSDNLIGMNAVDILGKK